MEIRPGYKNTEVGIIPIEWEVKKISEFTNCSSGGTPSTSIPKYWNGSIKWMSSGELNQKIITDVVGRITEEGLINSSTKIIPINCVLIGLAGQGKTRGTVAINRVELCTNQSIVAIWPSNSVYSDYLFFNLDSRYYELRELSTGEGGRGGLNLQIIRSLLIPIPPKFEQEAIAKTLSDIDALIESLEQLIIKKREIKQGVMQELLTGNKRLPGFTDDWEKMQLGDICEIEIGRTPPRNNKACWGSGFTWLSIADLRSKIVTESNEEVTKIAASDMKMIPKGTLLMSFKLSIGRLCFAGCNLFTNEAICCFKKPKANVEFLYYILGRTDFSLYGKLAVKGYTLNMDSLKLVKINYPSIEEQVAIATILSDTDAEIDALESKLSKVRQLKEGMMHELITGRIRLT